MFFLYILIFFLGASFGSFINLIVDRLYVKSFLSGRSVCDKCAKKINFYDLIPILSFLFLKGRCRNCKTRLGFYHIALEFVIGILFVIIYINFLEKYFINFYTFQDIFLAIFMSIFWIFLIIILSIIFLYDLRHKYIPLSVSIILILIGLGVQVYRLFNFSNFYFNFSTLFYLDLFSGFLISLPFFLIWLFSKGKSLGLGDIFIFFAIGYLSGFIFGVSIFIFSIWLAAFTSIFLILFFKNKFNFKSEIPFAPFIILATFLVLILQIDVLGLSNFFK